MHRGGDLACMPPLPCSVSASAPLALSMRPCTCRASQRRPRRWCPAGRCARAASRCLGAVVARAPATPWTGRCSPCQRWAAHGMANRIVDRRRGQRHHGAEPSGPIQCHPPPPLAPAPGRGVSLHVYCPQPGQHAWSRDQQVRRRYRHRFLSSVLLHHSLARTPQRQRRQRKPPRGRRR